MVNHELSIRGKDNLKSVFSKVVLNRSADLLPDKHFRKFIKSAKEIECLKLEWTKKMMELQEQGFKQYDLLNLKKRSSKTERFRISKESNTNLAVY